MDFDFLGDILASLDLAETKGESTDFTGGEEATQVAHGVEEECSDDEMVFEAYVSPCDVVEDQDDLPLDDEDMKVSFIVVFISVQVFISDTCYRVKGNQRKPPFIC